MTDKARMIKTVKDGEAENRPRARRIFRNFSFLTGGKALGDVLTFLLFIVLSRAFGQEGIGQYSFAMALTGFFAIFADFGLYELSIKEMSRRTSSLKDYYSGILSLRIILSATVFGILLLVLPFLSFPTETRLIIALIGGYQILYTLLWGLLAVFVAREDMHLAGLLEFSLRVVIALAGLAVVAAGGSLVIASAAFPVVTFAHLLVAYGIVANKYGRPELIGSWSFFTRWLFEAVPYALSLFFSQTATRIDIVLLGFFLGAAAAGVYNVAYRVVFFLLFLPAFIAVALFPVASKLYATSQKEFEALYHKSLNLVILVTLPAASGLWLIAPALIDLIFGKTFAESAVILRFLAWLLLLVGLECLIGTFLTSCDRQVERTKSQWTAVWVNVLANIILIPLFELKGAAVAAVLSEGLLVILLFLRMRALVRRSWIRSRVALSAIATAAFCFPLALLPSLPLGVVIPAAVLIYGGTLALFKDFRRNEVSTLLSLLKRESGKPASTGPEIF
jgi:O-antigen/teichoic acid export membrane protein